MVGLKVPEEKRATFMVKKEVSVSWILKANEGEITAKIAASTANNREESKREMKKIHDQIFGGQQEEDKKDEEGGEDDSSEDGEAVEFEEEYSR